MEHQVDTMPEPAIGKASADRSTPPDEEAAAQGHSPDGTFEFADRGICLSVTTVGRALVASITFFVSAGLLSTLLLYRYGRNYAFGLVPLFDLNGEYNLPTLFSFGTLMSCAVMLCVLGAAEGRARSRAPRYWYGLAAAMFFLAVDEVAEIHEKLGRPLLPLIGLAEWMYVIWTIPYMLAGGALAVLYLRFWLHLPRLTRWMFFAAGLCFVAGAVVMEIIGANYLRQHAMNRDLVYGLLTVAEETLEMMGSSLFLYALLIHAARHVRRLNLSFSEGAPGPTRFPI